jgi:ATP-dependent protease ClpP protease subunit
MKTKNERTDEDENTLVGEANEEAIKEFGTPAKLYKSGILPINIIGEVRAYRLGNGRKRLNTTHYPVIFEAEENPDVRGILLTLNTMGGDVEAGLAISELIAGMTKPTVSLVLGGGHSIGVPLAVCTNYSFIAPTATMTIHPIRTNGLVIGVAQSFDYFKRMQERIVRFVITHSI